MKITAIVITAAATLILAPILRGYALSKLWLWFIVSSFGVVPLGIAQSVGIALVAAFLTHQPDTYEDKDKSATERFFGAVITTFLVPALTLLVGWVVKGFIV